MKFWRPKGDLFPLCHYLNLEDVRSFSPVDSDGKFYGFKICMKDGVSIPFSNQDEVKIRAIHNDLMENVGLNNPRRVRKPLP